MTGILARLDHWSWKRERRRRYRAAERVRDKALAGLATGDPANRGRHLHDLANGAGRMGDLNGAALYAALATVEDAIAWQVVRNHVDPRIEDAVGLVLDAMVARPELRAELARIALPSLRPVVGDAVDILRTLYPANVGRVVESGPVR